MEETAARRGTPFKLVYKPKFHTYQMIVGADDCDNDQRDRTLDLKTFRRVQRVRGARGNEETRYWARCLAPLSAAMTVQVHEHCFNCSAVPACNIMPLLCGRGADMFTRTDADIGAVQTSLAVNNAKAQLERLAHSLVWSTLNRVCDLACWRAGTHDMTYEEEARFYTDVLKPRLKHLVASRDNYAQSAEFCQRPVRTSRLFRENELTLVSHKYGCSQAAVLFARSTRSVRKRRNRLSRKTTGSVAKRTFAAPLARNASVVKIYACGPRVFRDRFAPLSEPEAHMY